MTRKRLSRRALRRETGSPWSRRPPSGGGANPGRRAAVRAGARAAAGVAARAFAWGAESLGRRGGRASCGRWIAWAPGAIGLHAGGGSRGGRGRAGFVRALRRVAVQSATGVRMGAKPRSEATRRGRTRSRRDGREQMMRAARSSSQAMIQDRRRHQRTDPARHAKPLDTFWRHRCACSRALRCAPRVARTSSRGWPDHTARALVLGARSRARSGANLVRPKWA